MRTFVYVVVLSLLSAYPIAYALAPTSFIIPGRPVMVEGIVVDKYIGEGGNVTMQIGIWHTVSIRLSVTDPVNRMKSGDIFAYVVSKADFERVNVGSLVQARVWTLHAQIVAVEG